MSDHPNMESWSLEDCLRYAQAQLPLADDLSETETERRWRARRAISAALKLAALTSPEART